MRNRSLFIFLTVYFFSKYIYAEEVNDVVNLESVIVGDKEQPAVSYFIPWKGVGTPDKLQWEIDKKHDNTLDVVDRDVMLRSMTIYKQMKIENPSQ